MESSEAANTVASWSVFSLGFCSRRRSLACSVIPPIQPLDGSSHVALGN
uniref:Uncharacterized protein n=1 Tax=Anguilla anguilla TaxID=7936 RepID=A0A0E9PLR0_ANGAN